jgi:hypothetical protein
VAVSLLGVACQPYPAPSGEEGSRHLVGRWTAEAVHDDLEDELVVQEDGSGDATIHRETSALFAQRYVVTVDHGEAGDWSLSFRCEIESPECDRLEFDPLCELSADDILVCDAPSWYHEPDWLVFERDGSAE